MTVGTKSKVMSGEEIERAYPDTWVLVELTRHSWRTGKYQGRVLFASEDRDVFAPVIHKVRSENPNIQLYVHYTGPGLDPNFDGVIVL
jgi:hypothetical protein